jgi:hypothetical protein
VTTRDGLIGLSCAIALLVALPVDARDASAQIAARCKQKIENNAVTHGGPPAGSPQANEHYRDCWEGAVRSRDGTAPDIRRICGDELSRRGWRLGTTQGDQAHRQCVDRELARTAPVLAAVQTCLDRLRSGPDVFGSAEWDRVYDGCMQGTGVDRSTVAAEQAPKPFGRGKVQAYLNALYHDDQSALRATDKELTRLTLQDSRDFGGIKMSLLEPILQNYLIHYPVAFKDCLAPDSPKITIGSAYDRVRRRGGVEVSRETIDTRRDVRVARHLYPLAQRIGASSGTSPFEERLLQAFGGADLQELRGSNISEVVAKTMNGLKCTDPVVKQLESRFLKYAPMLMPQYFGGAR